MSEQGKAKAMIESVPLGSELFRRVEELIASHRAVDPFGPVTVVTPYRYSAYYLRRRLAQSGYFNVHVTRLEDLAELLGARPTLTRLQAAALVYESARIADLDSALEPIRLHPALHAELRNTFRDLDAVGEHRLTVLDQAGTVLQQVAALYRTYLGLSKHWREQTDMARRAAENKLRNRNYVAQELGKLIALRIDDPPVQLAWLDHHIEQIEDASILVDLTGNPAADNLVASPTGGQSSSSDRSETKLISAPNRAEEVRYVVRDIVRRASEHGTPPWRMAVLFSGWSYGGRVDEALRMSGMTVSGPDHSLIAHSPDGRFVAGVLRLFQAHTDGGWSRDDFVKWITSAPVVFPGTAQRVPSARWDATSRKAGVTDGIDSFRTCLTRHAKKLRKNARDRELSEEHSPMHVSALRSEAQHAEDLLEFAEELSTHAPPESSTTFGDLAQWLRSLRDRYMLKPEGEENLRVWGRISDLLRRVEAICIPVGASVDFDRFAALIREELDRPRGNVSPLGRGVFAAPLHYAAGCDFDVVYVLGMSEGSYPSPPAANPLLNDHTRRELDRTGKILPDQSTRTAREHRTYLTALMTAPVRYLLWPRADAGDRREVGPARWFIDAAREITGNRLLQGSALLEPGPSNPVELLPAAGSALEYIAHPADRHEYILRAAALHKASNRPRRDLPFLLRRTSPLSRGLALQDARASSRWTEYDGNLIDAQLPGDLGVTSATSFATWADCPYRYFLSRLLRVEETEAPEKRLTIDRLQRGQIVHKVLEKFVKKSIARGTTGLCEQRELLEQVASRVFKRFEKKELNTHKALWSIERASILKKLTAWLPVFRQTMDDLDVKPCETEMTFYENNEDNPNAGAVDVQTSDGLTVSFRGRIDLVAKSDDGSCIAVFDYKMGSANGYSGKGLIDDPTDHGRKLQLPVYVPAAKQALGASGSEAKAFAAYWFVLDDRGGKLIPEPLEFDEQHAACRLGKVVSVIARDVTGGVFPAVPRGFTRRSGGLLPQNCGACPYDTVCPSDRRASWERKNGDPLLRPYLGMQE